MPKITFNSFSSLTNETSFLNQLNENFTDLRDFLDTVLNRDGTAPNTLTAELDANSQDINNVGTLHCTSLEIDGEVVIPGELSEVPAGTIPGTVLEDGAITASKIAAGAVSSTALAAALYKQIPKYIVRVAAAGGIRWASHAGITVTRTNTGRYDIDFPSAFASTNSMAPVVSVETESGNNGKCGHWAVTSTTRVRVTTLLSFTDADYDDNEFTLVVYGDLA